MSYLEQLLHLPSISGMSVSPNGKWVAWTWFNIGQAGDVYVAATDGSSEPIRLTNMNQHTWITSWLRDSSGVLVKHDHDGDEKVALYKVLLSQPETSELLSEEHPPYYLRGGQIHPTKPLLFYCANYDFEKSGEIEPSWLYKHDLESGEKTVLAKPNLPSYYSPKLNSTGTHILYQRSDRDPSGEQIWLVDIEGKQDREIINLGDKVKVSASWCPDGKRIVVLGEHKDYRRLGVWSLDTEKLSWLVDDPRRNIEDAHMPNGTGHIVIEEVKNARSVFSLLDPDTGREQSFPTPPSGNVAIKSPVTGKDRWLGLSYGSKQPADIITFDFNEQPIKPTSISKVWSQTKLQPDQLGQAEDYWWKASDGLDIQGWLYKTEQQSKGLIVYVHGGPTAHSEDAINSQIQYYLSLGFNVLDPNYRGSTGFGLTFQDSIKENGWGAKEQDDIICGVKALIKENIAEENKVGITGTSYGGYSSWHAITHYPTGLIAAAAPICGMTDLVVDYETTRPDIRPYSEEMMGGAPSEVPGKYEERSPIRYVKEIKGKLLIIQGLQDPNVSPANVEEVERALELNKIEYKKLLFKDEGHGISKTKNKRVLYERLAKFFQEAFNEANSD